MVVKFAIEPDALTDSSYNSLRDMRDVHKRLIRLWEKFGLLVDPGVGPSSIRSKFDSIEFSGVRKMWQDAWKTKQRCRRSRPGAGEEILWESVDNPARLKVYENLIDLALVEHVRGTVGLQIPEANDDGQTEDVYSVFCGKLEASLARFAEHSRAFRYLMELSQRTVIPANQDRARVWATWFQTLAENSREIIVLDRYAFSRSGANGIFWTLESLANSMSDGVVEIYSSNPSTLSTSTVSESDILTRVRSLIVRYPRALKSITVLLVADNVMTRDRYIRFDDCAFSIGHGIAEAFNNQFLARDISCHLDTHPRGIIRIIRNEEQRLYGPPYRKLRFDPDGTVTVQ